MLRPWFTAHLVTVRRALAWFGVTEREDRADLTQDVFFSAYLALVRGEQIENPRAWLRECARRHASNYRHKEVRRSPHIGGDLLVHAKDPEQIVAARERLHRAIAGLSEDAQSLLFDIRADGVSWAEVARERGITIDQARYIYQRSVSQMEEVLNRDDSKEKTRHLTVIPFDLVLLGGAASAEASDVSPDTSNHIWRSLEQRMGVVGVAPLLDLPEQAQGPTSSPLAGSVASIAPPAARSKAGSILADGLVTGALISYLLLSPSVARSPPPARPLEPTSTPAAAAAPDSTSVPAPPLPPGIQTSPVSPPSRVAASTPTRREPPVGLVKTPAAPVKPRTSGPPKVPPSRAAYDSGSMALIDQARSSLMQGKVVDARDLSSRHTRQFLEQRHAAARRDLLRMMCASSAGRGAPECSRGPSSGAPD